MVTTNHTTYPAQAVVGTQAAFHPERSLVGSPGLPVGSPGLPVGIQGVLLEGIQEPPGGMEGRPGNTQLHPGDMVVGDIQAGNLK